MMTTVFIAYIKAIKTTNHGEPGGSILLRSIYIVRAIVVVATIALSYLSNPIRKRRVRRTTELNKNSPDRMI